MKSRKKCGSLKELQHALVTIIMSTACMRLFRCVWSNQLGLKLFPRCCQLWLYTSYLFCLWSDWISYRDQNTIHEIIAICISRLGPFFSLVLLFSNCYCNNTTNTEQTVGPFIDHLNSPMYLSQGGQSHGWGDESRYLNLISAIRLLFGHS